jgi:LPS sulfotransferase NodH
MVQSMPKVANFIARNALATRKAIWRAFHSCAPNARAVFVLGAQRSGTTLLLECMERSNSFEVLGETSRAMDNYRIRSADYIRNAVRQSHNPIVVFKPLTDSHRARDLLGQAPNSKAIWAFRRVEDRVNSAIAKFGDHNLQVLRAFSKGEGLDRWQAQGLTSSDFSFIRKFDYTSMSPHDAAALFWYLRNSLYFKQNLERAQDVLPLAYEDLVSDPQATMVRVCGFLGAKFDERMIKTVHAESVGRSEARVSSEILALCQPLYEQLRAIQNARFVRIDNSAG